MAEPNRKPNRQPESYQPKKPEIVGMVEQAAKNTAEKQNAPRAASSSGGGRILPGVMPLEWEKGMDCCWAGALTAALQYMGEPYSYEQVMGLSGACYRLNFTGAWDWSATDALVAFDYAAPLMRAIGYENVFCDRLPKEARAEERERIMADLRRGRPVLGINLRVAPEWGVITGYGDNGKVFYCRSYFDYAVKDWNRQDYLETDNWPFLIQHFGETLEKPSALENLQASLRLLAASFEAPCERGYYQGREAYTHWIAGLCDEKLWGKSLKNKKEDIRRRLGVNESMLMNLADARRCCAAYLRESAALLPGVEELAAAYEEIYARLRDFREKLHTREAWEGEMFGVEPGWFLCDDGATWFNNTPGARREQADLLDWILKLEAELAEKARSMQPESYQPKKPEIVGMVEQARTGAEHPPAQQPVKGGAAMKPTEYKFQFSGFRALDFTNCFASLYQFLEDDPTDFFFLFDTVSGRSASLRGWENKPTAIYSEIYDTDDMADFIIGFAGYAYEKHAENLLEHIRASVDEGIPVLARLKNRTDEDGYADSFRLITGTNGNRLLMPEPNGAQKPPKGAPKLEEIDLIYVITGKTQRKYTLLDGLRRIKRVMDADRDAGVWDTYIRAFEGYWDRLKGLGIKELKRMLAFAHKGTTWSCHNFAETFRLHQIPEDIKSGFWDELREPRMRELCKRIDWAYDNSHTHQWQLHALYETRDWSKKYYDQMEWGTCETAAMLLRAIKEDDEAVYGAVCDMISILESYQPRKPEIVGMVEQAQGTSQPAQESAFQQPAIITKQFRLAGFEAAIDLKDAHWPGMDQVKAALKENLHRLGNVAQPLRFIDVWEADPKANYKKKKNHSRRYFFIGVEVMSLEGIPEGFVIKDFPETAYALFKEREHGSPKFKWLEEAGYKFDTKYAEKYAMDIEIYDSIEDDGPEWDALIPIEQ